MPQSNARKCFTCDIPICPVCLGHIFPPNEALIASSDKAHGGEKRTACVCSVSRGRVGRKYEKRGGK